ncbi:MAG TPA: PH domain-containing protein [Lacunisphaera sp.]|jgi:membrane protein YdbS with pleckstrin-like domain
MYEAMRRQMLALLKVPAAPHPPAGNPGSLQVFRAGKNYYNLRLTSWGFAQLIALVAIIFWTGMLIDVEATAQSRRATPVPLTASPSLPGTEGNNVGGIQRPAAGRPATLRMSGFADKIKSITEAGKKLSAKNGRHRGIREWIDGYEQMLVEIALVLPPWAFPLIWTLKITAFVVYLFQIPVTYAARRLDYELRWYMVTDRSLRLRYGVWKITESTMSFANVQQVVVSQGPLQRWLGLANVEVKSAGGGTVSPKQEEHDMHTGIFQSVTNAPQIRDLILERLRQFRAAGLGDPDEGLTDVTLPLFASNGSADAVTAAREFLAETRALRQAVS